MRAQGLRGWWSPADQLLAWVSVGGQDVLVLGVVPWNSASGGRVQHIVKQTPKRDKSRVLDFLSLFRPMEFILGELGSKFPESELRAPLVFLARFGDNVYIFMVNMRDALAAVIHPVIFEMMRSMYQVPHDWEVPVATVQWCGASIPPTRDLRLLWKGVVLDLNFFSPEEAEWSRCIVLVLKVRIKPFCPCLALQNQMVLNEFPHSYRFPWQAQSRQQQEDEVVNKH